VPYGLFAAASGEWWAEDYNMKCYEGTHLALALILGVPGILIICLGVPIGSALFLVRNRKHLHKKSFIAAYGFLYGDYEDQYCWWDSVIALRKFLIVVVIVFVENVGTDMQLLVALGAIIGATVVHMMFNPYRYADNQWTQSAAARMLRVSSRNTTLLMLMLMLYRIYRLDVLERISLWGSTLIIYLALYFIIQSSSANVKASRNI
jgi:hypothetical protein